MSKHEAELIHRIETGEGEGVGLKKTRELGVVLKEERVTIRLTREEVLALDRECKALGVGRSTMIRMILRQFLGLAGDRAVAGSLHEVTSGMLRIGQASRPS